MEHTSKEGPPNGTSNELGGWQSTFLGGLAMLIERWKLIVSLTLLAGVVAAGVAYWLPRTYTSVAYIGPMEEPRAKTTQAIIQSGPVLDPVIVKFPQYRPGFSIEEKRVYLNSNLHWQIVKGSPTTSAIYTLTLEDADPHRAQAMLTATVDGWLEAIRPRPDRTVRLKTVLEASEAQAADLSQVIVELRKRPDAMFADARNGYFPPNIVDMIKMRTEIATRIVELTMELRAGSHDMIFGPPTLPEQPSGPHKRAIVLVSMLVTLSGLIGFFLLRWQLAIVATKPAYAAAFAQIRRATPWSPASWKSERGPVR
jgi:hypothetical protein